MKWNDEIFEGCNFISFVLACIQIVMKMKFWWIKLFHLKISLYQPNSPSGTHKDRGAKPDFFFLGPLCKNKILKEVIFKKCIKFTLNMNYFLKILGGSQPAGCASVHGHTGRSTCGSTTVEHDGKPWSTEVVVHPWDDP